MAGHLLQPDPSPGGSVRGVVTTEIYEKTIRELGLRMAQVEIDRAMLASRLRTAVESLEEMTHGDGMAPEMRARLQTLVVTLSG